MRLKYCVLFLLGVSVQARAAGKLEVEGAWIRTPPPGATMLAGYAILKNAGDAPLVVSGASSVDFADVSMHESVSEHGVERMRPLPDFVIAPAASVAFAPGGKHWMLMHSKRELHAGDVVKIHVMTTSGAGADAQFTVRDTGP